VQRQKQKQIPFGNDNQKGNDNGKGKNKGKDPGLKPRQRET